mmetsp:Transcript_25897/g.85224  ORF Transcript_25897/g.85224 Transcript_25897/m.85224 type:complete len:235 (+) Transcript_25897:85-789(+)
MGQRTQSQVNQKGREMSATRSLCLSLFAEDSAESEDQEQRSGRKTRDHAEPDARRAKPERTRKDQAGGQPHHKVTNNAGDEEPTCVGQTAQNACCNRVKSVAHLKHASDGQKHDGLCERCGVRSPHAADLLGARAERERDGGHDEGDEGERHHAHARRRLRVTSTERLPRADRRRRANPHSQIPGQYRNAHRHRMRRERFRAEKAHEHEHDGEGGHLHLLVQPDWEAEPHEPRQ